MRRFFLPLLLAASSLAAAELPTGEEVFQWSVEKSGGADALSKIKNSVMTGTVNMAAQGMTGTMKIYVAGEKSYTVIELPGIGKVEEGYNGDVAWEVNAIQGARIKEGAEKTAMKNAANLNMLSSWKDRFKGLRTVGMEDVEGKPAYKVEATPKEGKPMTFFVDKDSGLMVKMSMVVTSPMGELPTETFITDYRPVQGIQTPFTMTQKVLSQSIVMKFDAVEYNTKLPDSVFDLPAAVKAMQAKKTARLTDSPIQNSPR